MQRSLKPLRNTSQGALCIGPIKRRGPPSSRSPGPEIPVKLRRGAQLFVVPVVDRPTKRFVKFRNYKVVYRRYAGLFFCVCVDANDNELAYLEAIHLFVEVLGESLRPFEVVVSV